MFLPYCDSAGLPPNLLHDHLLDVLKVRGLLTSLVKMVAMVFHVLGREVIFIIFRLLLLGDVVAWSTSGSILLAGRMMYLEGDRVLDSSRLRSIFVNRSWAL